MSRRLLTLDEHDLGISWVVDEPMQRASHALVVGGRTWLVDPVDVDEAIDRVLDGLETPVGDSDTLVILPAMAGGE